MAKYYKDINTNINTTISYNNIEHHYARHFTHIIFNPQL